MGLLRAELLKLARHPLLKWLAAVLLGLVLLGGLVFPPDPALPWAGLWSVHLIATGLIVLTAVTTGMEFSEDTFRSLVGRGVPRWALLLSKFTALVLVGGVLLGTIEGLAVLLGVRSELRWGELWRAWPSLWPYVSIIMFLTVLARSGGLALVLGVMQIGLEYVHGMLMGPFATLPLEIPSAWRFLTHEGLSGTLYQWSLSYNGANWTYLAEWQRAPIPDNVLLWVMPHSVTYSVLVLAAYVVVGLGLSSLIVYRRDVTMVVPGKKGLLGLARRRPGVKKAHTRIRRNTLPAWTAKGPLLVRLARAHLFKMRRTSLVKIGTVVSLLFPLVLWGVAKSLKAAGFQDFLFSSESVEGTPLAFIVSLLIVGPLATVIGILAVSNELSLGTRRAELTRGTTRLETIVAQSLALVLILGAMFAFLMLATLLISANVAGTWPLKGATLTVLVSMLAAVAYMAAAQVGGALTRSPLGAMLFGLGFLVVDWLAILAPTLIVGSPGILPDLVRYTVTSSALALAGGGQMAGIDAGWEHLGAPGAALVLLAYAIVGHTLAALIAHWRDA